uniref:MalT-like TPR region domain-containing protein n=1 Tax=Candidatus Kentrum eta TaxID=2126337 RepID=A0A450UZE8_9GAMM|nr:MAG: hypothetical protein BECKH772A_GA0070896_1001820 [Candidatus Kentron sp. H]VFJ90926.1 MAG: hypothetical protein BECKH772B_GA0070898_1001224 [Candidatus Kentron sp. H]VFJ97937.1 MAG: hypothetical protein BECKH772C_GA0070978_1001720 [Candidatus Kentron sp. H]
MQSGTMIPLDSRPTQNRVLRYLRPMPNTHLNAITSLKNHLRPLLKEHQRAGLEMAVEQKNWLNAAIYANNLSELELALGGIAAAIADAESAVAHAERSGEAFQRLARRTDQADALHQAGEAQAARALFEEAEAIQAEYDPEAPRLYSGASFRYCEWLLSQAERAAWRVGTGGAATPLDNRASMVGERPFDAAQGPPFDGWRAASSHGAEVRSPSGVEGQAPLIAACIEAAGRAEAALVIAEQNNDLLGIALHRLTLARAALYRECLAADSPLGSAGQAPAISETLQRTVSEAVDALRQAGTMDHLPRGLLTRAWVRALTRDLAGAEADLIEAQGIAEAGPMPLFLADIHLTRARLSFPRDPAGARADLLEARRLIGEHGYHRRDGELADAQAWIGP